MHRSFGARAARGGRESGWVKEGVKGVLEGSRGGGAYP